MAFHPIHTRRGSRIPFRPQNRAKIKQRRAENVLFEPFQALICLCTFNLI
jgi:hypothetical protein